MENFGGKFRVESFWWTIFGGIFCWEILVDNLSGFFWGVNTIFAFVRKFLVWKRNNLTTFVFMYKYKYENTYWIIF